MAAKMAHDIGQNAVGVGFRILRLIVSICSVTCMTDIDLMAYVRFYLFTRSLIVFTSAQVSFELQCISRVDGMSSANVVKSVVEGCKWLR